MSLSSTINNKAKSGIGMETKMQGSTGTFNQQIFKRNKKNVKTQSMDPKNFSGETGNMNGHLFQTIKESKDATQYVKTVKALKQYAFKTYKLDLSSLFQQDDPEMPTITIPSKPSDNEIVETPSLSDIYQLKLKEYTIKEEKALNIALKSVWTVIWDRCSTSIRTKLEKKKDIKEMKKNRNVVQLLSYIQQACMNYKDKHHPCVTLCQQYSAFHLFFQREGMPIQKYLQIFRIIIKNIEQ